MSIKIMTLVWDTEIGPATKRLVLLALADSANDEGMTWPLMGTLARRAACGLSTARRVVAELEAEGWLDRKERRVERDRNQSNIYQLNVPAIEGAARSWREGAAQSEREVPPNLRPPAAQSGRENRNKNPKKGTTTPDAGASEQPGLDLGVVPEPPVIEAKKPESAAQRANRLTAVHYEALGKMGSFIAMAKIVRKAIDHPDGWTDEQILGALDYIRDRQWTLTGERLWNVLHGGPKPAGATKPNVPTKAYTAPQMNGMPWE